MDPARAHRRTHTLRTRVTVFLHGRGKPLNLAAPVVGRVTTKPLTDELRLADHVALIRPGGTTEWRDLTKYAGVIGDIHFGLPDLPTIVHPANLEYLGDGDVV